MSLVNDVLRDLESNRIKEREFAHVLSAYKIPQHDSGNPLRKSLLNGVLLLSLVVTGYYAVRQYQAFQQQQQFEAFQLLTSTDEVNTIPAANESAANAAHGFEVLADLHPEQVEQTDKGAPSDLAEVIEVQAQAVIPADLPEKKSTKKSYNLIEKVENGDQFYQLALNAFRNKAYQDALPLLNKAIAIKALPHYISLQARLYIESKDRQAFTQLQTRHSHFESQQWLQLMAAGYQKLSDYPSSNNFYLKLLQADPQNIQWRLAIAMNHQRMGNQQQALSHYRKLHQYSGLSSKQNQWIQLQLKLLERSVPANQGGLS